MIFSVSEFFEFIQVNYFHIITNSTIFSFTIPYLFSHIKIAMKRREVKSKGEKERYTYLNAEFQRIARRDKKAFLSHQYKE